MDEENNEFGILNEGQPIGMYTYPHSLGGCCSNIRIDFDREEVNGNHDAFIRLITLWPHLLGDPEKD